MEVKKGYKKTIMGEIPEDWQLCQFSEVMDGFSSGQTPYRAIRKYYKGEIPWITSGELNYNIITETNEKITEEAVRNTGLKIIPEGSFLFAITGLEAEGTRGSCAITGIDAATNQSCMALYPKKNKLITPYLYQYYLRYGNELALKYCQGTKQQSFTSKIAKALPIIVPLTVEEQSAISTVLVETDALVDKLEKLIEKKCSIKQGIMQKLLRPKAHWKMKTYGEVFSFLNTATYSRAELSNDESVGYVHYGDIHTKWNLFLDVKSNNLPTISEQQLRGYSLLKDGDIVMADASEDYSGVGKCVEVKNLGNRKVIAGLHTFLLRDTKDVFINGYRGYIHTDKFVKNQFDKLATGMKVYGVSKSNLKTVVIPVPPKDEQIEIAQILSDMESEISNLAYSLEKLKQTKQGMMQQLLTGKIRLA